MNRRQCRFCDNDNRHGLIVSTRECFGALPGFTYEQYIRVYQVECNCCGHTWQYRKKAKK